MRLPGAEAVLRLTGACTRCRGCLGVIGAGAEAGLCVRCWSGLAPLPEPRCPRCALPHDQDSPCPESALWTCGDAFWDYHGGRPSLGALLVPGIKAGELGWRAALLRRAAQVELPAWADEAQLVTCAPTAFHRRFRRGFDLAEDTARLIAERLDRPFQRTLTKALFSPQQSERTESERRRLPRKAFGLRRQAQVEGRVILLVDDVWTTGTTLTRCAAVLKEAGAEEVRALTLFRAL